ncbi:MAG TPA: class I SAM-dependent methyltransferase [Flavobacteriales bacterium]|nr:class I SAM-dependent methyltransferase [Flavobacteriales bacterium]
MRFEVLTKQKKSNFISHDQKLSFNYKIKSYLTFKLKAKNEYSLHSPFMFELYNNVFKKARKRTSEFDNVEEMRKKLLADETEIEFVNLGAGGIKNSVSKRKISQLTKTTSKKHKHARFLAYLAHYLQSKNILELGTSLGISTLYLAKKNIDASITTVEGSKEVYNTALNNFRLTGFTNIKTIHSDFDSILPDLIKNQQFDFIYIDGNHSYDATKCYFEWFKKKAGNETVIVFDDIYWSADMTRAWKEIYADTAVTVSIDLFEFGIVFFRKELSKQHFVLRY